MIFKTDYLNLSMAVNKWKGLQPICNTSETELDFISFTVLYSAIILLQSYENLRGYEKFKLTLPGNYKNSEKKLRNLLMVFGQTHFMCCHMQYLGTIEISVSLKITQYCY